jgi:hypothetical protein
VRRVMVLGVLGGVFLSGCSGSIRQEASSVPPPPPISRILLHGYRVVKTYRADLSGGAVPDVIVSSEDPSVNPNGGGVDLQVLSWNRRARRWRLTFDGRTAPQPNRPFGPQVSDVGAGEFGHTGTSPVLQGDGNYVTTGPVSFARLLGGDREQMIFGGGYAVCCGVPGYLAVVSYRGGIGRIIYAWQGTFAAGWQVSHNIISAQSMVQGSSQAGPLREYRFALGAREGRIVEIADDRPFLGVILRYRQGLPVAPAWLTRPVVVSTIPHGPSAGLLRPGDVILSVLNGRHLSNSTGSTKFTVGPGPETTLKYPIGFTVGSFKAGQTVRLLIRRGGKRLTVRVKLDSLMSPEASAITIPSKWDDAL